jgi:hypothetical protein
MGQIYRNYLQRNCGLPSTRVHSIDEGVAAMHKGYAFCDTGYREIFVRNVTPNKDAFMEMIAVYAIMEDLDHFDYFSEEDKERAEAIQDVAAYTHESHESITAKILESGDEEKIKRWKELNKPFKTNK